jgi:hypothetical protein
MMYRTPFVPESAPPFDLLENNARNFFEDDDLRVVGKEPCSGNHKRREMREW